MEAVQVLMAIGFTYAAAQIIGENGGLLSPKQHHMHLNGCVLPITNELMEYNESRSVFEVCQLITCQEDRKISYKRCENFLLPENCTLTDYNFTLPYPNCCPSMICNQEEEGSVTTENLVEIVDTRNKTSSLEFREMTSKPRKENNVTKVEKINSNSSLIAAEVSTVDRSDIVKENDSNKESAIRIKHDGDKFEQTEEDERVLKDETAKGNQENYFKDGSIHDEKDKRVIHNNFTGSGRNMKTGDNTTDISGKTVENKTIRNHALNTTLFTTVLKPVKDSNVVQEIKSRPAIAEPVYILSYTGNYKGCYSRELDVVLPIGVAVEPIDGSNCRRFICQDNGEIVIATCGVTAVPPYCITQGNLTVAYPDCCPKVYCPINGQ